MTLLLHGFSRDGSMWAPLMDGAAPNLPGHRGAAAPSGTFEEVVDALAGEMTSPTGIVGYSMGARLALSLAVRHSHLVRWLILDGASLGLEAEEDRAARRQHDAQWAQMLRARGIDAFAQAWEAQPIFGGRAHVENRREHQPAALADAMECFSKGRMPFLGEAAREVKCPVLLLNGESDEKGLQEAEQVRERIPHAQQCILKGHHAAHLESPQQWREAVAAFLKDVLTKGRA